MEAAAPGEKIVKWGGLEGLTLVFFSLKVPFSEFFSLLDEIFPTWVYKVDAKFK